MMNSEREIQLYEQTERKRNGKKEREIGREKGAKHAAWADLS